ncbi:molecular chaperone DnaJ, partial [Alphaproteobacteria bacterium]|nr:molecular chaperone DnaJ [Alphaproteobacteria bacterium]
AGACDTCDGSGTRSGSAPVTCNVCNGHGKVRAQQGFFMVERACHNCQGSGQMIQDPCGGCQGRGTKQQQRNLTVAVPAGVEDGTRIRLSGEGNAGGPGSTPGDLYVFVSVRPHAFLQRDGADLFCGIPIAFDLAARGGSLDVPLLNGKRVKLSIPSGAQSGQQFRLRGKGMPVLRSRSHGDLYVQIDVEVPSGLNKKQQALLDAFTKSLDGSNYPDVSDFTTRSDKANS